MAFAACQKEEPLTPEPVQEFKKVEILHDDPGLLLAKNLSLTLQDAEVRKFIQDQAVKQFDGDYDILLSKAQHESLSSANARGAGTFGQILSGGGMANARTKGLDLDKMLAENPLLQIAVPELPEASAESWDAKNYSPIVVYRVPGVDLNEVTHLPAFDAEGNPFDFNITEVPTQPIIVVSNNERLTAVPKGKSPESVIKARIACATPTPYYTDANFDYYFTPELYCSEPYPSYPTDPGTGGGTSSCDRDNDNQKDYIKKVRFTGIKTFRQAEAYVDGNPEVFVVVTFGAKDPGGFSHYRKYIPSTDRNQWKDCSVFSCKTEWYDETRNGMPLALVHWDKDFYGDRTRHDWFEYDQKGKAIEYTVSLTTGFGDNEKNAVSGSVKYTITNTDYILGHDVVEYCDKTSGGGTLYTTGFMDWYIGRAE